ncbi:MAG: site-2 protease family protein [Ardenticatenaceae bacterium]|nr:site-2 protease family protein [Ardenticatenaceae bacterium]
MATLISRAIVLLVAFTIHELSHAVVADRMGDPTPRRMGRITLNPIAHLDPIGTILLLVSGFGWAKPVMINPMNLRGNPRTGMAIVAAAGPISNVVMAVIFAIPFQLGLVTFSPFGASTVIPSLSEVLFQFVWINLILAFFNLIPIPPLDGYKILTGILPPDIAYRLRPLEQYGFLILMGAIFILPMLGIDIINNLIMVPSMMALTFLIG